MDYTESNVTTNSVMECSQEGVCERVATVCIDNNPCSETRTIMSNREVEEERRQINVSQTQELMPADDTLTDDTSTDDTSKDDTSSEEEDDEERTLKYYPGVNFAIIFNGYDHTIIVSLIVLFLFIVIPFFIMKAKKFE